MAIPFMPPCPPLVVLLVRNASSVLIVLAEDHHTFLVLVVFIACLLAVISLVVDLLVLVAFLRTATTSLNPRMLIVWDLVLLVRSRLSHELVIVCDDLLGPVLEDDLAKEARQLHRVKVLSFLDVVAVHDNAADCLLLGLDVHDPLINRTLLEEANEVRSLFLAYAPHPTKGLVLHGAVPPQVYEDDAIGAGQVEGDTSTLEAADLDGQVLGGAGQRQSGGVTYQNSWLLVVAEKINGLVPLVHRHGANVVEKGDVFLVELASEDLGEVNPLREDCVGGQLKELGILN